MTDREQEILKMLKENPMISQEALADKLNLQRSSVAVHISNLIKKGKIKGKGYILSEDPYAVVIGGCNMDILGKSLMPLKRKDSNIGRVNTTSGGVGRNIAENLARLGIHVKMISAVGKDTFGEIILNELSELEIDISGVKICEGFSTSTYLAVSDETGDMEIAISHMDIVDEITIDYINQRGYIIQNAEVVVLDANLTKDVIEYILQRYGDKKIFVDTVSTAKASKFHKYLDRIYFIKPNIYEARLLVGSDEDLDEEELVKRLASAGVKKAIISLGEKGSVGCFDKEIINMKTPKAIPVNTTGAGDAFMAGIVYSEMKSMSFVEAIKFATMCSAHNVEQIDTVSKALNEKLIIKLIKEKM